jgi:hypothetical protein
MTSDIWAQILAGLSGIASAVVVRLLDEYLKRRDTPPEPPPQED